MITEIKIKNRIAQTVKNGIVPTANAENYINFTFDDEWEPDSVTATRTARFTVSGKIVLDIPFNGNVCPLPVFFEPCNVYVGVFWNDFRTSTKARIIYAPSTVSGGGFPDDPPKDVYDRIVELMNGKLNADQLFKAIEDALLQAKESGDFDGEDGVGIVRIERTSGNGSPGSTDVYTITLSDDTKYEFSIYNGKDGAGGAGEEGTPNAVQFVPQELTAEQQAQARANINAVDADSIPEWAMQPNKPTYTKREIGLGNVDNVEQYSEKNPPPYPVTSVNGKKGAVNLSASDVGADASGTAASAVSEHNTNDKAHSDIRLLIEGLATRLSGIADSDDTTLDQLSEIVAYIKSNKSLIDSITTNKVNVSDIINNLTSNVSNKPLSAAQGVALKKLIDALDADKLESSALEGAINIALEKAKESGDFDGEDGAPGKTPARGTDYWTPADKQEIKNDILSSIITQEAGESESLVMSQKAATALVREALGSGGTTEYETVDSIDKMTDTSKSYVLSTTGTIWAYGSFTEEKEPENKFVPSTATLNARHGTSSTSALNGYFVTDYIKVDKFTEVDPYIMRVFKSEGVGFTFDVGGQDTGLAIQRIHYFDANKTLIANKYLILKGAGTSYTTGYTDSNGNVYFHIDECMSINGTYNPNNIIEIPDFDHSLVKYVRVTLAINGTKTAITSNDVANVIITFDADGGTVTTYKWYDTGMRPSTGGGGGGNYVDLLVKVNQNKTVIAEVSSRVTALETGSSSVTIPSFWKNAVDACVAKIEALQVGRNCVTFPFFSDNHQRNGYVGMLIAHVMKERSIPYAFFGGDTIDSGYIASESVMIAQDKAFDETMSYIPSGRFCRAVGNHDGYWAVSASEKHMYTREQIYDLFLREEGLSQNKHFGEDGTYYYIDDIVSKVRFIVLNTNKISLAETSGSIDSTQLAWLQSTALKFSENGWGVVIFSHFPITNHYHSRVSNATEVVSVVNNANVDIIGWFSGHIHRDRIYTHFAVGSSDGVEGTNGEPLGFTQVTITSDHTGIAYDDATKHTIANDDQSHAIDFVTINKATRTVNITRLGIGNDRSYTY